jgi:hypothetical protein
MMTREQANEHLAHIITAIILLDDVDFDGMVEALDTRHQFNAITEPGNPHDHTELAHLQDVVHAAHAFQSTMRDLELARMQAGAP